MASARRTLFGELCAEFAGTLILILFGVGVVAQVVTSHGAFGDHDSITWGWGLGVVLGIYTAARVSAAHLNPAVTLALAVFRGFEWRKVLPFCAAQMLGAFVAALIVRAAYGEAIGAVDPRPHHRHPGDLLHPARQRCAGHQPRHRAAGPGHRHRDPAVLVLAITDVRNNAPVAWMAPFIIGLVVVGIGMAWGTNAGYAINPARDFGPGWRPLSPAIRARSPTRAEPCTSGCRSWVRWSAGCSALPPMSGSSSVSYPESTSPRKSVRSRGRRRICRATAETHDRERRSGRAPGRHGVRADPEHLKSQRRSSDYSRVCRSHRSGHDQYPIHAVRPRR
jgi:glycerol uptake facilitator protein